MKPMIIQDAEISATIRTNAKNIMHLMDVHGMTFDEAADFLGIKKLDRENCRPVVEEKEKEKQPASV